VWQGYRIGSVEPDFIREFHRLTLSNGTLLLQEVEQKGLDRASDQALAESVLAWQVNGDLTSGLNQLAQAMRSAGLCGAWRNEQLAVKELAGRDGFNVLPETSRNPHSTSKSARVLGTIERGAVRPLGIATQAVHLVGFVSLQAQFSHMWVQQRAWSKPIDPGQYDTLMGGMVPAQNTLEEALARETWEEAGLLLSDLPALTYGGRVSLRRPAHEASHTMGGAGYMVEQIDWFLADVPVGRVPDNQDGEVDNFSLLDMETLLSTLYGQKFTTEASMVLAAALGAINGSLNAPCPN
jgi:8-oxo-dGTP pyrophosphatase MutT (NUDIX family)